MTRTETAARRDALTERRGDSDILVLQCRRLVGIV